MKDISRAARMITIGVLTAGAVLVGASAAATAWAGGKPAAAHSSSACGLGANSPTASGNTVSGTGSRTGCGGTTRTLTVQVRKHRSTWLDKVVAESSRTNFGNGSLTASGKCAGSGTYFTEARSSSGNKQSSGRVGLC